MPGRRRGTTFRGRLARLLAAGRTVGGRATPAAQGARLAAGRGGADEEALSILFDQGLGKRIEIGEDLEPEDAGRSPRALGRSMRSSSSACSRASPGAG
jgi:hypothetical protein